MSKFYRCFHCANEQEFDQDPNHDPMDACGLCRRSMNWEEIEEEINMEDLKSCVDAHVDMDLTGSEFADSVLKEAEKSANEYMEKTLIAGLSSDFTNYCRSKLMVNFLTETIEKMYDEVL